MLVRPVEQCTSASMKVQFPGLRVCRIAHLLAGPFPLPLHHSVRAHQSAELAVGGVAATLIMTQNMEPDKTMSARFLFRSTSNQQAEFEYSKPLCAFAGVTVVYLMRTGARCKANGKSFRDHTESHAMLLKHTKLARLTEYSGACL